MINYKRHYWNPTLCQLHRNKQVSFQQTDKIRQDSSTSPLSSYQNYVTKIFRYLYLLSDANFMFSPRVSSLYYHLLG